MAFNVTLKMVAENEVGVTSVYKFCENTDVNCDTFLDSVEDVTRTQWGQLCINLNLVKLELYTKSKLT